MPGGGGEQRGGISVEVRDELAQAGADDPSAADGAGGSAGAGFGGTAAVGGVGGEERGGVTPTAPMKSKVIRPSAVSSGSITPEPNPWPCPVGTPGMPVPRLPAAGGPGRSVPPVAPPEGLYLIGVDY